MSLESEIAEANAKIVMQIDEASKIIVVEAYKPLFEKVKAIALVHMQQSGQGDEIGIGESGIYFRSDGNFYSYSHYAGTGTEPLDLKYLPTYFRTDQKPTSKPGFTKFQSEMDLILNEFRNAVKTSLANLV